MAVRVAFEKELMQLKCAVREMHEKAEISYNKLLMAAVSDHMESLEQLLNVDGEFVDMQRKIEAMCLKLLTMQQPIASDLRVVSAALKVVTDIERIGDHVTDMAELFLRLRPPYSSACTPLLQSMMEEAKDMVHDAVEAFVTGDLELAQKVILQDDVVDEPCAYLAINGQYAGRIVFGSEAKPDAAEAITILSWDRQVTMITDDSQAASEKFARQIGIENYYPECQPNDKVAVVRDIRNRQMKRGNLLFVGDAELDAIRQILTDGLKNMDDRLSLHDLRMVKGTGHTNLIFDIAVPHDLSGREKEMKMALSQVLAERRQGKYYLVITFDRGAATEM